MNPFPHTLLFGALFLLTIKELTEACSCALSHPQQQFCQATIVVRAKVIGETKLKDTGLIQYEIKMIKMFKGFEKITDIRYVYTQIQSSMCGVSLDVANKKEYLLAGNYYRNRFQITLCDFNGPWNQLSEFQVRSLSQLYQRGCVCKITICAMGSCDARALNECLWRDWQKDQAQNDNLAKNYACIKQKDGSCSWYPSLPKTSADISHP